MLLLRVALVGTVSRRTRLGTFGPAGQDHGIVAGFENGSVASTTNMIRGAQGALAGTRLAARRLPQ